MDEGARWRGCQRIYAGLVLEREFPFSPPFVSSTSPLTYDLCLPVHFFIRKCDVANTTNALSEQHIWRSAARDVPRSYVRVIVPAVFFWF